MKYSLSKRHNKQPYQCLVYTVSTDDNAERETSANLSQQPQEMLTGSSKWDTNADIVSCCNHGHLNMTIVSNCT